MNFKDINKVSLFEDLRSYWVPRMCFC